MTRPQIIVDCETTALLPDYASGRGVIWELALIDRATGSERLWLMKPDLAIADPAALAVGRYYDRTAGMCRSCPRYNGAWDLVTMTGRGDPEWSDPAALAEVAARLLDNATLIAANPAFDAGFLAAFLNRHGQAATWHYRLRDIGSMAWARLRASGLHSPAMDASTAEFAVALGVDPEQFGLDTALGDCRLVAAMLDVIEGGTT